MQLTISRRKQHFHARSNNMIWGQQTIRLYVRFLTKVEVSKSGIGDCLRVTINFTFPEGFKSN